MFEKKKKNVIAVKQTFMQNYNQSVRIRCTAAD